MNTDLQRQICDRFALGVPTQCTPLPGTRNLNYVLHTDSGRWFVRKRYHGYAAPARIVFDHAVLDHLNKQGVPTFAPIADPTGSRWVRADDAVWEVYPFIEGRPFEEGSPTELRALGACVAALHEAGRRFSGRYDKLGPRGETDPNVMRAQADEIEQGNPGASEALARYREWIDAAEGVLSDERYAALPHTIVHGDLQPANVLMRDGRVAALVDFDWCAWRPRVYDLAFALLFACSVHETPIDGSDIWSLTQPPRLERDLARAFLDAYDAAGTPLSHEEREAVSAQVVLSWCHSRVAGALKAPALDRARFLEREPLTIEDLVPPFLKT